MLDLATMQALIFILLGNMGKGGGGGGGSGSGLFADLTNGTLTVVPTSVSFDNGSLTVNTTGT